MIDSFTHMKQRTCLVGRRAALLERLLQFGLGLRVLSLPVLDLGAQLRGLGELGLGGVRRDRRQRRRREARVQHEVVRLVRVVRVASSGGRGRGLMRVAFAQIRAAARARRVDIVVRLVCALGLQGSRQRRMRVTHN